MIENLIDKLENLIKTLDLENYSNPYLEILLIPNWTKEEIGKDYYASFKNHFQLEENDYIFQNQGGETHLTSVVQLADFSIALGIKNGAEKGIKKISQYLESDTITAYELMLLPAVHLQTEFKFSNGVKLIFPNSIPHKFIADKLKNEYAYGYAPSLRINSALILKGTQSKFLGKRDDNHNFEKDKIDLNPLYDALYCLSLCRPIESGIQPYAISLISNEELPFWRSNDRWRFLPYKKPPSFHSEISNQEFENADKLLKLIRKLPTSLKNKLTISLDKLNDFGSGLEMVDRAINLRICLESIFLNDGNKEQLRFTLALRGSLYLGESYERRKEIFQTLKKAYDITSTAVHEGIFKVENEPILNQAAEIAKEAIIKIIENGKILNWNEIELGKGANE